jgi:hypothetical protein
MFQTLREAPGEVVPAEGLAVLSSTQCKIYILLWLVLFHHKIALPENGQGNEFLFSGMTQHGTEAK